MSSTVRCLGLILLVGLTAAAQAAPKKDGDAASPIDTQAESSVVKVFSTVRYPDPFRPWTKQAPRESSPAAGVVIEGKRILTNAHVVLVREPGAGAGQPGRRQDLGQRRGHRAGHRPRGAQARRRVLLRHAPSPGRAQASFPQIKDAVLAYGYPDRRHSLSITKGIVSRIEFSAIPTFVQRACASRSTPPSTPATAAAPPSSATR